MPDEANPLEAPSFLEEGKQHLVAKPKLEHVKSETTLKTEAVRSAALCYPVLARNSAEPSLLNAGQGASPQRHALLLHVCRLLYYDGAHQQVVSLLA